MSKKTEPCVHLPSEFYGKRCQAVCDKWTGTVSVNSIIDSFACAAAVVTASHRGLDIAWLKNTRNIDFDETFRANRLLVGELLVAIERSQRNPDARSLSVEISHQMIASYYREAHNIPKGPMLNKETAAFITTYFGKHATEASVKMAIARARKHTESINLKWSKLLSEESRGSIRLNRGTQSQASAANAALYADPERPRPKKKASPKKSPSNLSAKIQAENAVAKMRALDSEAAKNFNWFTKNVRAILDGSSEPTS